MADQNLNGGAAGKSHVLGELSDILFGIAIPSFAPRGVFPLDPDFGFSKKREWQTKTIQFSPLISQRYIMAPTVKITFTLGFNALRGTFDSSDWNKNFLSVWEFFNSHKGRLIPFYFYDPSVWAAYADEPSPPGRSYRTYPPDRLNHPTDSAIGRYICNFKDDMLETEVFEWKLRKAQLILEGFLG